MGGRDWGAGEDKEPLSKLVMSTLLTATEEVLTSMRVVMILAVMVRWRRCITLVSPNHERFWQRERIRSALFIHKGQCDYILSHSGY